MGNSLYNLTIEAQMLQEMLENGDIDETIFQDTLESLDIDTKIENVCKMIRNLEQRALMFKTEKDRMADRQRVAENCVKRLKENLLTHMQMTANSKLTAGLFTVSKGKSKSVNLFDETIIPENFLIPQPSKVDKKAIGDALKKGETIAGAELVENEFIRIK
ncbi:MAG: siphovirus Gp157 family protein [Clostridia bacterium]|nr:siphovirus Gp157 family protein [Clostridia bacterium]